MSLFSAFYNSSKEYPFRDALVVENIHYTYKELQQTVGSIAYALSQHNFQNIGILSYRSMSAYAGILATLQSGKTYVPLNLKFPLARNQKIIDLADVHVLVVDKKCLHLVSELRCNSKEGFVLVFPELNRTEIPLEVQNSHITLVNEDLSKVQTRFENVDSNNAAYIMFTSGSTGIPKGVPVSHANVKAYLEYLYKRYSIKPEDRFSQTFDITFDLSVHDMFLAWRGAASLYSIPENKLMAPAKFIKENELTFWFSVPSLAQFMNRFRMLKPGSFPSLRYSLFCGEPLPKSIAISWQQAANLSVVENIYGPTEATIGISHYALPSNEEDICERNGIVAIGQIFKGQQFCLTDESGVITNREGELCLSGSQVTTGYWQNEKKTKEQFFRFTKDGPLHYRTGDLVEIVDGNIYYKSRVDFQVKIRGYRVELDEINLAISKFNGASIVCTIPHPINEGVADNLISFIDKQSDQNTAELLNHLSGVLPEYMIPKKVYYIDDFPLNSNGKIDRKALISRIKK